MKKIYLITSLALIWSISSCRKESKQATVHESEPTQASSLRTGASSNLLFQKTFGSSSNELGYCMTKAADGSGFVFVGSVLGNGGDITGYIGGTGADAWVVKVDNSGSIIWKKCIGGTNSDYAADIIATSDGGYLFAGQTKSNDFDVSGYHGGWDVWVVKLDGGGSKVWEKTLGGSGDELNDLYPTSIVETSDGGFIFVGTTTSNDGDVAGSNHGGNDAWILKLNSTGNLLWQKTFGGSLNDYATSIIKTKDDNNYMVCGYTSSIDGDLASTAHHGAADSWLFKINDNGDLLWQKTYGGSQNESCNGIQQADDGTYVFSGTSTSNDGDVSGNSRYSDTWVVKLNADFTIHWQKFYGGNDVDRAPIRSVDGSGNILLVGYTFSRNGDIIGFKGGEDLWVLRLDGNGNKLNSIVFGGKAGDEGQDVVTNSDGSYTSIGRTNSTDGDVTYNHGGEDVWLVKFKF